MMVKNEEKHLEEVLKSLNPFFDSFRTELIIVDTGSEDNTVNIAKKYTDKVYYHQWDNDFGSMRNKTIQYATGEWILILDGDEVFTKVEPLINFLISDTSKDYNSAGIIIKNLVDDNEKNLHIGQALRLFRNTPDFRFEGRVHEQPRFKVPIFMSDAEVVHYGYISTDKNLMEYKFRRNVAILKEELKKDPNNIYYLFQLSQSYGMYRKYRKSLDIILKAYELLKEKKDDYRKYMYVYAQLARAYYQNCRFKELEDICIEALEKIDNELIDFYYFLGVAQSVQKKNVEAIKNFEKYLKILEKEKYNKSVIDFLVLKSTLGFSDTVCINLAELYKQNNEYLKSLKYIEKINKDNLNEQTAAIFAELYIELDKYDKLREKYNEILKLKEENNDVLYAFWSTVENGMERHKDKKVRLMKLFSEGDCYYSLLNRVRLNLLEDKNNVDNALIKKIREIDFGDLPNYFADLIYALMIKKERGIGELLANANYEQLQSYITYLVNKYDEEDIENIFLGYLKEMSDNRGFNEIRFQKELRKSLLINNIIGYEKYRDIFEYYLSDGFNYIEQIYSKNVIENELIYDARNSEDRFLIYMLLAMRLREKDKVLYVRYLRKALKVYSVMKPAIEMLLEELQQEEKMEKEKSKTNTSNEFNELKNKVKESISVLFKSGKIIEAKILIDEYLDIVPNDLEMLALKSEILQKLN